MADVMIQTAWTGKVHLGKVIDRATGDVLHKCKEFRTGNAAHNACLKWALKNGHTYEPQEFTEEEYAAVRNGTYKWPNYFPELDDVDAEPK